MTSPQTRSLARRIDTLERLIRQRKLPTLGFSSIEDGGAIMGYDDDGNPIYQVGTQWDGTYGVGVLNGPIPPTPTKPLCQPTINGARVTWDGMFTNSLIAPMDFARVEVHASTDPNFTAEFAETIVNTCETPRGGSFFISLPGIEMTYVRFVCRSTSGNRSPASEVAQVISERGLIEADLTAINDAIQWHVRTFYGDPAVIVGENVGDILFDTTDGFAMYRWDGDSWETVQDAGIALAEANASAALASANGKNTVHHKTFAPTNEPNIAGDTWFQYDGSNNIVAQYRGTGGTSWTPETLGHQVISSVDLGKATVGFLDGVRIAAKTVTADKLLIGFGTNGAPNPGFETGSIEPYRAVGGATGTVFANSAYTPSRSGTYSLRLILPDRATGYDYALTTGTRNDPNPKMPVKLGDRIRAEAWLRVGGNGSAMVYIDQLRQDGTVVTNASQTPPGETRIVDTFGPYVKSVTEVEITDPETALVGLAIGAGNGTVAGDQMWIDDLRLTNKVTGELIVNGGITANHFNGTTFNGVSVTGALIQTNADGPGYGTTPTGIKISTNGIIGYDSSGVARTVISPTTGQISAQGTLQSVAANGTAVAMKAVTNPFESGQNWALAEFTTGLPGWAKGLIWGWDDGTDDAALRISSPYNEAAAGDTWFKSALLDLRANASGATSATLHADLVELRGGKFTITSADSTPVDFNIHGHNILQFQQNVGTQRLALEFGNGINFLRSRTKTNAYQALQIEGTTVVINPTTSNHSLVASPGKNTLPWFGRADGAQGIRYNAGAGGGLHVEDYLGNYKSITASSHPTSSDRRHKTDITALDGAEAVAVVKALDMSEWTRDGLRQRGVVAQDLAGILPTGLIADNPDSLAVDPMALVATLWTAVQHLLGRKP